MDTYKQVDAYIEELFIPHDTALEDALKRSDAAGLPKIQISASQGKFLQILARMQNAKKILEIGTLGGYSTIWLARALAPEGKLITLEYEPKHAEIAKINFDKAGLSESIDLRLGAALDVLPSLESEA